RKEVYESIKRENAQASRLGTGDLGSLAQTVRPGPSKRLGPVSANPTVSNPPATPGGLLGATAVPGERPPQRGDKETA
ncbi:MAG: hypothetical protein AAGA55_11415, partial [Planctomycetota bacterium]